MWAVCPGKEPFLALGLQILGWLCCGSLLWAALLQNLVPAPEQINPDDAGNNLSSPRMALDVSKRTLPRKKEFAASPAVGRDVLGALGALRGHARAVCQFRDLVSLQMEVQDCQEKPVCFFFLLKLHLNQHQEMQAPFLCSPIIMEEMQGGRGDISSDVLSTVPQPPLYPR